MKQFLLLLISTVAFGQAIFDNYTLGSCQSNIGGSSPVGNRNSPLGGCLWFANNGGVHENYPNQTLTFTPGTDMAVGWGPGPAAASIVDVTQKGAGVKITTSGHIPAGGLNNPVNISGVTGLTGINGYNLTSGADYQLTIASSTAGSPVTLVTTTAHNLTTGDWVAPWFCSTNSSIDNPNYPKLLHEFQVTVVNSTTVTLDGSSGAGCPAIFSYLVDTTHIDLLNVAWPGGSYAGGGTIQIVGGGRSIGILLGGGTYPTNFWAGNVVSGSWDVNFNRMRFDIQCDNLNYQDATPQNSATQIGTYLDPGHHGAQGVHIYNLIHQSAYPGRTQHWEINRKGTHSTSFGGDFDGQFLEDWTYIAGSGGAQKHTFDALNDWYIQDAVGVSNLQYFAGNNTCKIGPITLSTVTGEADHYVSSVTSTWHATSGSNGPYEVKWEGPGLITGGANYHIRYSTAQSLHTLGFANGTDGGTAVTADNSAYCGVFWQSPAMAEAANMWVAIQPTYVVNGLTWDNSVPKSITAAAGDDLVTGDTITTTGIPGVTDGTYTITRNTNPWFAFANGELVSIVVSSGTATVTTLSPHGLIPGREVVTGNDVRDETNGGPGGPHQRILTVPTSTTFTYATTSGNGTCAVGNLGLCDQYASMGVVPSFQLDGTAGAGSSPSLNLNASGNCTNCGTFVAANRFYEVQIPLQLPDTCGITTTSFPAGTVGQTYSQIPAASNCTPGNTWSVASGSLPAGTSIDSTTGRISGTLTTAATSTFTLAYDTATSSSLSILVNAAPTITTSSLPGGTVGTVYSQTLSTSGGTNPQTCAIQSGSLPTGLSISSACAITGTPSAAGSFSFVAKVTDINSVIGTKNLSISISSGAALSKGSTGGKIGVGARTISQ